MALDPGEGNVDTFLHYVT
jgi:hypothetical protein